MPHNTLEKRCAYIESRKEIYAQHKYRSHRRLKLRALRILQGLKNRPCGDCGGWFEPCQMEFDHIDPKTKKSSLSNMRTCSVKKLLEEVKKCRIICSNCHALRTYQMQHRKGYWKSVR